MWIPQSSGELIAGLPGISESAELEFKEQACGGKERGHCHRRRSNDHGWRHDYLWSSRRQDQGTFTPAPIPLPGAMERISNVVKASIAGSPSFDVFPLDPGHAIGFLVVSVPASMNAPHQVTAKGQHRFYGGGPGGNTILSQGEIDRLYARRGKWVEEGSAFLDSAISDMADAFRSPMKDWDGCRWRLSH